MNIHSCSLFAFSFGVLLIGILVISKRYDEVSKRFFIFSLVVSAYGFPGAFFYAGLYSKATTLILCKSFYIPAVFIPITWIHFVFTFIDKKEPWKGFYFLNYFLSGILVLFVPSSLFVRDLHSIMSFKYYTTPGVLFHFFTLSFCLLVPYALYHLIKVYWKSTGETRKQLKFLVIGSLIGFSIGGATFLPVYGIHFPIELTALMSLFPIFTGIALIRHGLFDYDQIAQAFQREKLAAIGTMAASLNHELRNPLYIAKGRIESYLDAANRQLYTTLEEKNRKAEGVLQIALSHLTRAMDMMQRFSDFAKPFSNDKNKETVVLRDCVNEVLHLVSNEFEIQKIKLTQTPTDDFSVHANRRQLEEIFFNLIVNACQAMQETGGELAIRATQPNGKVLVEIEDTGPGIPQNQQKRIFEPFYSTKAEKGSGLGLYITKQLIERNGGRIVMNSEAAKGTKFTLTLPVTKI